MLINDLVSLKKISFICWKSNIKIFSNICYVINKKLLDSNKANENYELFIEEKEKKAKCQNL